MIVHFYVMIIHARHFRSNPKGTKNEINRCATATTGHCDNETVIFKMSSC